MSLDLDDAQAWRHASSNLVDFARIMDDELKKKFFDDNLRSEMLMEFWRIGLANAFAPRFEFGELIDKMFPTQEDD